jgi:hypothetical protein
MLAGIGAIVAVYLAAAELLKPWTVRSRRSER